MALDDVTAAHALLVRIGKLAGGANPDAETGLLDSATSQPVRVLREQAKEAIAAADPSPELRSQRSEGPVGGGTAPAAGRSSWGELTRRRAHTLRELRWWTEPGQVGVVQLRTTADLLADLTARLRPEIEAHFRAANKAGRREPEAAYAHDALLALLTGHSQQDGDGGARRPCAGAGVQGHQPGRQPRAQGSTS